tara:strand:+ start:173 stop:640 length:468 start_codon:yes stop_codon:yes gene_type:complete
VEDKTQEKIKEIKIVINSNFDKIYEINSQYNKIHVAFANVRKDFEQQLGTKFDNLGKPEIYNEKIQEAKKEKEEIFNTNVLNSLNNLNEKVKNIKKELINGWDKIYSIANAQSSQFAMQTGTESNDVILIDVFQAMKDAGKFDEGMEEWAKDIQK